MIYKEHFFIYEENFLYVYLLQNVEIDNYNGKFFLEDCLGEVRKPFGDAHCRIR